MPSRSPGSPWLVSCSSHEVTTARAGRSANDRKQHRPGARNSGPVVGSTRCLRWAEMLSCLLCVRRPVQFPHQGVVPKSRRLPSDGRSCRCKSCHPDQFFRCGVTAAQRPLKPSGAGAEPAAGANFRAASQDRAPTARAVRRKFATSKQPIGRARVRHAVRQHHTVGATQNSPRVVLPGWRAR